MGEKERLERVVAAAVGAAVNARLGADGMWTVMVPGLPRSKTLRAVWLRTGWPADVDVMRERFPRATLFAARSFSSGARARLDADGVNWVDETGAASINVPGLIVRVDRPPAREARPRGISWSQIAVRAAESVLVLAPAEITTAWVAEHADCSVPRASGVLQAWDAAGWTEKRGPERGRGAHRVLLAPDKVLESVTEHLSSEPLERWFAHATTRDVRELVPRLDRALDGRVYGWTAWAAAERLAPFVTELPVLHIRVSEVYTRRDLESEIRASGATLTEDAGRIELWRTPTDAFRHLTGSKTGLLMSWPRVYADLTRLGGRGIDAANHLRDVMQPQA